MQSDIVNFQRQGWRAEEILAGLAAVLPKNVFLYVASIPNLAALGSRFVLQGGTQNNLAVVKAEVDFIRSSFRAKGKGRRLSCTSIAASRAPSARRMEALRSVDERQQTTLYRPGSGAQHYAIAPRATKTHAATSARTIACAPLSTSM